MLSINIMFLYFVKNDIISQQNLLEVYYEKDYDVIVNNYFCYRIC